MKYKGFKVIDEIPMSNFEPIEKLIAREYDKMIAKDIVAVMKKYFPDSKINEKRVLLFARMLLEKETEGTE